MGSSIENEPLFGCGGDRFAYAVIGKGMIGTAIARYLSQSSDSVVMGPHEPKNFATHEGVLASHYDSGRITRRLLTILTPSLRCRPL